MYIWWQKENKKENKKLSTIIFENSKVIQRFGRKNMYAFVFYSKKVLFWGNKKITKTVIKIFPKTEKFIVKNDSMKREKPSSHLLYLSSIEEEKDDL